MADRDDISMDEISSVVARNSVQMQNVQMTVNRLNANMEKFAGIVDKAFSRMASGTQAMQSQIAIADKMSQSYQKYEQSIENASKAEKELNDLLGRRKQLMEYINNDAKKTKSGEMDMRTRRNKDAKAEMDELKAKIPLTKKAADQSKQQAEAEIKLLKERKQFAQGLKAASTTGGAGGPGGGGKPVNMQRGRNGVWSTGLEVASDANIPLVSQAATVGKYAQMGVGAAGEGGMLGLAGGALGVMGGLGVLGAGYTMMQGYKAYNQAHQMAPMARTLRGQGTNMYSARGALDSYGGYGGAENWQTLIGLNRQLGTRGGTANLRSVTDIANMTGMSREEVGGQAGALMRAGGARPETAGNSLKNILMEAVKSGVDRSRLTEFTEQVVNIQQDLYKTTGQNNAQGIAAALGQLMRGSGEGAQFLKGPAMGALGGIGGAMSRAGHLGLGGMAQGTMMRAFGMSGGGTGGLLDFMRRTEGGLFGKGSGQGAIGNLKAIFGQYNVESGGKKGGPLNDAAKLRMATELGIGVNQIEALQKDMRGGGGKLSKEGQAALKQMQEQSKDPMERLLDIQAKMDANIAKIASSDDGIAAVAKIDQALLDLQTQAVSYLEDIAKALAPDKDRAKNGSAAYQTEKKYMDIYNANTEKEGGGMWGEVKGMVKHPVDTANMLGSSTVGAFANAYDVTTGQNYFPTDTGSDSTPEKPTPLVSDEDRKQTALLQDQNQILSNILQVQKYNNMNTSPKGTVRQ